MFKVLTIVDIQNDFLDGGSLAIEGSSKVIPYINSLDKDCYNIIIMTQDWHPKNHISFADTHGKTPGDSITIAGETYTLWPKHCVQFTHGAEISKDLILPHNTLSIYKATNENEECYSCFCDIHRGIINKLSHNNGDIAFDFVGLATDYCVYFGVREMVEYIDSIDSSLSERIEINILQDGCAAIDEKNVENLYKNLPYVKII